MPARYMKIPVRIKLRLRPLLAAGAVLGLGTVATFASFTDNDTASTMFSTGTVDLALDATGSDLRNWTTLGMDNAKPGDVTYAPLVVSNIGTLDFTYGMATTVVPDGNPLSEALEVTVVSGAATCDASAFAAGAVPIASGKLSALSLSGRALSAKTSTTTDSETLCFKAELPSTADNSLQDESSVVTLKFTATQAA